MYDIILCKTKIKSYCTYITIEILVLIREVLDLILLRAQITHTCMFPRKMELFINIYIYAREISI